MTSYLWLDLLILVTANLAFCAALYLTKEAMKGNISWFNKRDDPKRRW